MGKILPLPFISASNLPGCLMPGRTGLSPEAPSPYLPDPDQRLPGFARAALLERCEKLPEPQTPESGARIDQKRIFSNCRVTGSPLGRTGAVMMDAVSALPGGRASTS